MSEGRPIAWILNLDAEHELESGRGYSPTARLREIVALQSRQLLGSLVGPLDRVLTLETVESGEAEGYEGRAWLPTRRALRALEKAGARLSAAPSQETLEQVNQRPFAAALHEELREASPAKRLARNLDACLRLLAEPAPLGWLVRRTFGAAGRGRRRLHAGTPSPDETRWLVAGLRRGPLVVEPWVRVTREFTRSGWVARDGSVHVARPCLQRTTDSGAWISTRPASSAERDREDDARLEESCARAGEALATAGYFGPFGIDAFRHDAGPGTKERLNPLSEINARYTMDWTTGMTTRPDLAETEETDDNA